VYPAGGGGGGHLLPLLETRRLSVDDRWPFGGRLRLGRLIERDEEALLVVLVKNRSKNIYPKSP